MGRVVKGASVTGNAYQMKARNVQAPRPVAPVPSFVDFDAFEDEPMPQFESAVPTPAQEQPDFDAARAEAAKIVEDASADAARLIEEAKERALALVDESEKRANEIAEEARRLGHEQGVSDGRAAAQAEMDEMLETMRGLVEMARAERHKIIEGAEPEIVRLSVAIAERVINTHLDVQPNAVLEMTRAAIARLVGRETVTVRVNPSDIELMREHRERLMSMNDIDNLRLIEDQRVDRGGVVIDTEAGTIDAKTSTQLREVRRVLAVEEPLTVTPSNGPAIVNAPAQAS